MKQILLISPTLDGGVGTVIKNQYLIFRKQCSASVFVFNKMKQDHEPKKIGESVGAYWDLWMFLFKATEDKNVNTLVISHVVQVNFLVVLFCFVLSRLGRRAQIVCYEHIDIEYQRVQEGHGFLKRLRLHVYRMSYFWANSIIFVSTESQETFARQYGFLKKKMTTIYNPIVSTSSLSGVITPSVLSKRLIFVGRNSHQKGLDLLRLIVHELDKRGNSCDLLLYGVTADDVGFDRLTNVKPVFFGFHPEPFASLGPEDILLLPSRFEGLPTVVIEALLKGMKVVAFGVRAGIRESLANGKFGEIVPFGDISAFADAIQRSLSAKKTFSQESLKEHLSGFSFEKHSEGINLLFA